MRNDLKQKLNNKFSIDSKLDEYEAKLKEQYKQEQLLSMSSLRMSFGNFVEELLQRLKLNRKEVMDSYLNKMIEQDKYEAAITDLDTIENVLNKVYFRTLRLN